MPCQGEPASVSHGHTALQGLIPDYLKESATPGQYAHACHVFPEILGRPGS